MQRYTDEVKAKVVSEWTAGASFPQLSHAHDVPVSTIQGWVKGRTRSKLVTKKSLQEYDFDEAAEHLIDGSVRAYQAILRAAEDPEWIKGHSPSEAAILAGVIADKLYRLLGAIERPASDAVIPERTGEAAQSPMAGA